MRAWLVVATAAALEPRSFIRRQGHTTKNQRRALRELWPRYGVDVPWNRTIADVQGTLFGRDASATCVLDVGFGHGDSLVGMALRRPDACFLGVEMHRPGVGAALLRADAEAVDNVRIARVDAVALLDKHLPPIPQFDECCFFFPDPWFKDKDAGRRILRPWTLDLLAARLRPGGKLRVATDVDAYAAHVRGVVAADPRWTACEAPWRPETMYERRGVERGRAISDMAFELVN